MLTHHPSSSLVTPFSFICISDDNMNLQVDFDLLTSLEQEYRSQFSHQLHPNNPFDIRKAYSRVYGERLLNLTFNLISIVEQFKQTKKSTTQTRFNSKLLTITTRTGKDGFISKGKRNHLISDKEQFTSPHHHDTEKRIRAFTWHHLQAELAVASRSTSTSQSIARAGTITFC